MGYDFFLKFKNGKIVYVSPKRKEALDAFSDEEKKLTDFMKDNKVDLNSLADIKELVAFYISIKKI